MIPTTATVDPLSITRLLDTFRGAENDDLKQLFDRCIGHAYDIDQRLLIALGHYTNRLDKLCRARRPDRQALAGLLADQLIWTCQIMLRRFDHDDPFYQELAAILQPEAARAHEKAERLVMSGLLNPMTERWLTSHVDEAFAWQSWQEGELEWFTISLLDRFLLLSDRLDQCPASPGRAWVREWLDQELARYSRDLDLLIAGDALDRSERPHIIWATRIGISTVMVISLNATKQRQQQLAYVVAAHQRALADQTLSLQIPAFAVPDLDCFDVMYISAWVQPHYSGRVRALAFQKQCMLFGPEMTMNGIRAAERGQLSPVVMHELLHCLPNIGQRLAIKKSLARQSFSWCEGGQQAWAEEVCARSRDSASGLAGGSEYTQVYIGWKWAVRALADHLQQPRLVIAEQLGRANYGQALAQVARWLYESDAPEYLQSISDRFSAVLEQAHEERFTKDIGPATYTAVSELLDQIGQERANIPTSTT